MPPLVLTWRGPVTAPVGTVTVRLVDEAAVTVATTHVLFAPVRQTVWLPSINHAWKAFEEISAKS